jgi:eukaryotic-like serine/threonine-protein kinase
MRGAAGVLGPAPRLVLSMALHKSGQTTEARKALAAAIVSYGWRPNEVRDQDDWIYHVLRREAEAMILPNLPRFLQGKYQPQDNDERLTLLGICQFQRLCGAAARLFADAFAADPHLADHLTTECLRRAQGFQQPAERIETFNAACRYLAARCAALAGCGLGKDGANLSEAERTHWRKQAREWLQADLTAWSKTLNGDSRADRDLAKKMLMHWQVDPDLAGVRDPVALIEFSPAERQECDALWSDVAALLNRSQEHK